MTRLKQLAMFAVLSFFVCLPTAAAGQMTNSNFPGCNIARSKNGITQFHCGGSKEINVIEVNYAGRVSHVFIGVNVEEAKKLAGALPKGGHKGCSDYFLPDTDPYVPALRKPLKTAWDTGSVLMAVHNLKSRKGRN